MAQQQTPSHLISESQYNQQSFIGGMNLLLEDTHLASNQYKIGFDVRNRYDRLDLTLESQEDVLAPAGIKQEHITLGDYELLFVAGNAFYKKRNIPFWTNIPTFSMDSSVPRYWTALVPVATTNYYRLASNTTGSANSEAPILANNIAGAAGGNLPGVLVQDNINQPMFIFLNSLGIPTARITQTFSQWSITFTTNANTVVVTDGDKREYVPVGNVMSYVDGILYIASQDGQSIYRSVSGRPLDFVVNVTNLLATVGPPYIQLGGGDATTTSYSVGVGPITALRPLSDGSLFVSAANANFAVSKDRSPNATLIFGEYKFIRKFLFNATCLSDRAIFDSIGDTRFIDLTGVRSFNAIQQTQNEGRNLPFTANIRPAFGSETDPIIQDSKFASAVLFNDYELYAVQTVFGPAIAVYDTLNSCWSGFDILQTNGKKIKQLSKIELDFLAIFAITEDDRLFRLYVGPKSNPGTIRTVGVCSNLLWANTNIKMANPKMEIKPTQFRAILNEIREDCSLSFTPFINNRKSANIGTLTKTIPYRDPLVKSNDPTDLPDVNTLLENIMFSTPGCEQGWKCFARINWTDGSLTQFAMELNNLSPMNPLNSQDAQ